MSDNSFPLTGCVHSSTKNVFFTLYFLSEASRCLCWSWGAAALPGKAEEDVGDGRGQVHALFPVLPQNSGQRTKGRLCAHIDTQTQINTDTQHKPKHSGQETGRESCCLIDLWGCLELWVFLSMEMSVPGSGSSIQADPGASQLTRNTGLFADEPTTQCDRYKCDSAVCQGGEKNRRRAVFS